MQIHPVNAGHLVLGRIISSGEHLGDIDELHTGSANFGASPECLGIGGLPLFPHQRRSAARRA